MNLRGHAYQLIHDVARKSVRNTFFATRVVSVWNSLPFNSANFVSFNNFKNSITTKMLARLCNVNFN